MICDKIIVKITDFFQPGIIKILIKSCFTCNIKPSRSLVESYLKSCQDPEHFSTTRFYQDLCPSWTNSCFTCKGKLFKNLIISCLKSWHDPAYFPPTLFSQDSVVSSGKKCESLQDPDYICQGSATETSKIFPRAMSKDCEIFSMIEEWKLILLW